MSVPIGDMTTCGWECNNSSSYFVNKTRTTSAEQRSSIEERLSGIGVSGGDRVRYTFLCIICSRWQIGIAELVIIIINVKNLIDLLLSIRVMTDDLH